MSETVTMTSRDGVEIVGDLAVPDAPRAAAIICHPHPQYGGNRFNDVVDALFAALPAAGIAALRFDFRREFDDGRGEALDAQAALDHLADVVADVPLFATGYSFGAAVALGLDDERIAATVLVAPPLAVMDVERGADVPTLVLTPELDQFSPPAATEPIVTTWTDTTFATIDGADHFLAGTTAAVADRSATFLRNQL